MSQNVPFGGFKYSGLHTINLRDLVEIRFEKTAQKVAY